MANFDAPITLNNYDTFLVYLVDNALELRIKLLNFFMIPSWNVDLGDGDIKGRYLYTYGDKSTGYSTVLKYGSFDGFIYEESHFVHKTCDFFHCKFFYMPFFVCCSLMPLRIVFTEEIRKLVGQNWSYRSTKECSIASAAS